MFNTFIKKLFADKSIFKIVNKITSRLDKLQSESTILDPKNSINKKLFIYETDYSDPESISINLYCLYYPNFLNDKAFNAYLLFNKNKNLTINQDIKDAKYKLFAKIIVQYKVRFKGYYVDMRPITDFYEHDYTFMVFNPIYSKIHDSIEEFINKSNTRLEDPLNVFNKNVLNTATYTNPIIDDFYDSDVVDSFIYDNIRSTQSLIMFKIKNEFGPNMGRDTYLNPQDEKLLEDLIHAYIFKSFLEKEDFKNELLKIAYQLYSMYTKKLEKITIDKNGNEVKTHIPRTYTPDFFNEISYDLDNIKGTIDDKVFKADYDNEFLKLYSAIDAYLKNRSNNTIDKDAGIKSAVTYLIKFFKDKILEIARNLLQTKLNDAKESLQYKDLFRNSNYFNTFKTLIAKNFRFNEDDIKKEPEKQDGLFNRNTSDSEFIEQKIISEPQKVETTTIKQSDDPDDEFTDNSSNETENMTEQDKSDKKSVKSYDNITTAPRFLVEEFYEKNPKFDYHDGLYFINKKRVTFESVNNSFKKWVSNNSETLDDKFYKELEESNVQNKENDNSKKDKEDMTDEEDQIWHHFLNNREKIEKDVDLLKLLYSDVESIYKEYLNIINTYNVSPEQNKEIQSDYLKNIYIKCKNIVSSLQIDIVKRILENLTYYKENLNIKTLLTSLSWLWNTLGNIKNEILVHDSTRGIQKSISRSIRQFKNILKQTTDDVFSIDTHSLEHDTSVELSRNLVHLHQTIGEDNIINSFEKDFRPVLKFKYQNNLDKLSDLDSNIYQLKNMNNIFNIFDIDIDGILYTYDAAKNDFINTEISKGLRDKFVELSKNLDSEKQTNFNNTLNNADDYKKLLELLVYSVYRNSFGDFLSSDIENLGIYNSSNSKSEIRPRTFHELEKFLKMLQDDSGTTYFVSNGIDSSKLIKDSLQNVLKEANDESIKELAEYIGKLEQKFDELIK